MFIQPRYESNDFPSNNTIYLIFTIIINFYKFRYKIKKKKKIQCIYIYFCITIHRSNEFWINLEILKLNYVSCYVNTTSLQLCFLREKILISEPREHLVTPIPIEIWWEKIQLAQWRRAQS